MLHGTTIPSFSPVYLGTGSRNANLLKNVQLKVVDPGFGSTSHSHVWDVRDGCGLVECLLPPQPQTPSLTLVLCASCRHCSVDARTLSRSVGLLTGPTFSILLEPEAGHYQPRSPSHGNGHCNLD